MAEQTKHNPAPPIYLRDMWVVENVSDYKVHFGRWNKELNPLDEWVIDRSKWIRWQEYRPPTRNEFNRTYIFSLMNFYPEGKNFWLFGGVFQVLADHGDSYEVELTKQGGSFIGRLKLTSGYKARTTRVNFENHYDKHYPLVVAEILREPYSRRAIPN